MSTFIIRSAGGYNCEFLDDPVPPRFQCNICMKVLRDARLTECCGQHFCNSCLSDWLQRKKTCPHCRKEHFQSMINKEKIREINELRIRCMYAGRGCDWIGELGSLKDHRRVCGYVMVACTNSGGPRSHCLRAPLNKCWKTMERRFLARHQETECKFRPYTCQFCGYKDTYKGITIGYKTTSKSRKEADSPSHYSLCSQYPLECTNKCGQRDIKRRDMETHRDSCPLELLECPFKDAGCTDKLPRQDMNEHIESGTQHHLMMVFRSHQKLVKVNHELKIRVEGLEKQKLYH